MAVAALSGAVADGADPIPDPIARILAGRRQDVLRILTCGSVDDGKSTLIGRLFFETGQIPDDHLATLAADSRRFGTTGGEIDFALLVDGLEDERRQGITIDVAYRYFTTARRSFIVADTPGHEQYTRNMATGASTSDLAIILVDAQAGMLAQTRRHAGICSLLGIRSIVLAVNKMDLAGYAEPAFDRVVAEFRGLAERLGFAEVAAIPLAARHGDNVTSRSAEMPWYEGPSLLGHLETVAVDDGRASRPLRLPVQWVNRPDASFRGYAGTVASGTLRVGAEVAVAGHGRRSVVTGILGPSGALEEAGPGEAVTVTIADDRDIGRGDLLHDPEAPPAFADQFAAHLLWMADEPLLAGRQYLMRIGMRHVAATVTTIRHKVEVETLSPLATETVALNEIAVCNLSTAGDVPFDPYRDNRTTGSFILIDRFTNATVGAGMIDFALMRAANIHPQKVTVDRQARAGITRQKPAIVWFTGLSGSGKSTIADLVEQRLHAGGHLTYLLDGDNVRKGLNRDLGFTNADRVENIRRVGEVARLFVDAGLIVLCAFISPFAAERQGVRELVGTDEFFEVFVDTPLEVCMARDPKQLYAGARRGGVRNFTGIDSPYEPPPAPDLHLRTVEQGPDLAADRVVSLLREHGVIG